MAFSFVVEDGSGIADANSVLSVTDADTILSEDLKNFPRWEALATDEKERALAFATRHLDIALKWKGRRASQEQGLSWPRTGVKDADGYAVASDSIPKRIKEAAAYLAMDFLRNDPTGIDQLKRLESLRIDTIALKFRSDEYGVPQTIPAFVRSLIEAYGNSYTTARIVRS